MCVLCFFVWLAWLVFVSWLFRLLDGFWVFVWFSGFLLMVGVGFGLIWLLFSIVFLVCVFGLGWWCLCFIAVFF